MVFPGGRFKRKIQDREAGGGPPCGRRRAGGESGGRAHAGASLTLTEVKARARKYLRPDLRWSRRQCHRLDCSRFRGVAASLVLPDQSDSARSATQSQCLLAIARLFVVLRLSVADRNRLVLDYLHHRADTSRIWGKGLRSRRNDADHDTGRGAVAGAAHGLRVRLL